ERHLVERKLVHGKAALATAGQLQTASTDVGHLDQKTRGQFLLKREVPLHRPWREGRLYRRLDGASDRGDQAVACARRGLEPGRIGIPQQVQRRKSAIARRLPGVLHAETVRSDRTDRLLRRQPKQMAVTHADDSLGSS